MYRSYRVIHAVIEFLTAEEVPPIEIQTKNQRSTILIQVQNCIISLVLNLFIISICSSTMT